MDQRGIVERARRGDHDAFASLVDVHLARLDAAARLILRDPELARDAVQEALIRAWRDLPGLRDPDRFDAWLHRLDRPRLSRSRASPQASRHRGRAEPDRFTRDVRRRGRTRRSPAARPGPFGPRAGSSGGRRIALPAGDAAARGGGVSGYPARDREVAAALRARRDAYGRDGGARTHPGRRRGRELA